MAQIHTNIDDLIGSVDKAMSTHLVDMIKARLMPHAEKVVEEVAIGIATELSTRIEQYHMPTGMVEVRVWVGPKDKPKKLKSETRIVEDNG